MSNKLIKHKIKVTTFKKSGKYYDEFEIEIESKPEWYYVLEAIRKYKSTHPIQTDMDWLIGMSEEGLHPDVAIGVYPRILKG